MEGGTEDEGCERERERDEEGEGRNIAEGGDSRVSTQLFLDNLPLPCLPLSLCSYADGCAYLFLGWLPLSLPIHAPALLQMYS